jgi:transposase
MVLNTRRDLENGIRALLRQAGLKVGTPRRKDFPARVRELAADAPVLVVLAGSLPSVIAAMTREIERLTKRVLDEARDQPTCQPTVLAVRAGLRTRLPRPVDPPTARRLRQPRRST